MLDQCVGDISMKYPVSYNGNYLYTAYYYSVKLLYINWTEILNYHKEAKIFL